MQSILTYDMCSSLAQLCFMDDNLAKNIWMSIIPRIWNFFSDNHKDLLSMKAIQFLANSKLKNNFMTVFYEAIVLCKPKINFEPYVFYIICFIIFINLTMYINIDSRHLMVYIGKTYNLWHKVIEQMEDICNYFEHNKKNVSYQIKIKINIEINKYCLIIYLIF